MDKTIAFFDFDGTITTKDTMLELIKFHHGKLKFYAGIVAISPWMVAMKLKLISNQQGKEKLLSRFFKGMHESEFIFICNNFIRDFLPRLLKKNALLKIAEYKKNGHEVVVVSASASHWIKGWCDSNNLACIATELEIKDKSLTGKINGINCNYNEKANRIKQLYDLKEYSQIHCYGDTSGDKPMLNLATHPFYRNL